MMRKSLKYFLQASAHPTYDVRLVALEFWPAAITLHGSCRKNLRAKLFLKVLLE